MAILVFTGGKFPSPKTVKHFFDTTIDYVIAVDSGLNPAELYSKKFHFQIDEIIGDMDSLKNPKKRLKKYPKEIISFFSKDKDFSDTELGIFCAIKKRKNNEPIYLIGGDGGRIDHLFAIKILFQTENAPNLWLCKNQIVISLGCNEKIILSNITEDNYISIFPSHNNKEKIVSEGLFWPLENVDWNVNYSLSNKPSASEVLIHVEEGRFIIVAPIQSHLKLFQDYQCLN